MPAGMGSAVVLTTISHGHANLSLCTYALISPLKSQSSVEGALLLTRWVWACLRSEDADL